MYAYMTQHPNHHYTPLLSLLPSLKQGPLSGVAWQQLQQHEQQPDSSSFKQYVPVRFAFHASPLPQLKSCMSVKRGYSAVSRHQPRRAGSHFRKETNDVPSPKEVEGVGSEERGVAVYFQGFLASCLAIPL